MDALDVCLLTLASFSLLCRPICSVKVRNPTFKSFTSALNASFISCFIRPISAWVTGVRPSHRAMRALTASTSRIILISLASFSRLKSGSSAVTMTRRWTSRSRRRARALTLRRLSSNVMPAKVSAWANSLFFPGSGSKRYGLRAGEYEDRRGPLYSLDTGDREANSMGTDWRRRRAILGGVAGQLS